MLGREPAHAAPGSPQSGRATRARSDSTSLATSAPSTSRPPTSTAAVGASPAPSQAQATPKTTSSRPSSEISGALRTRATATAIRQGIANCTTPSKASKDRSLAEAANGSASGSVISADNSAPSKTAGSMSAPPPSRPFR